MNKILGVFLLLFVVFSCTPDKKKSTTTTAETEVKKEDPLDKLREAAEKNRDPLNLLEGGFSKVRVGLEESIGVVPGLNSVDLRIDVDCNVVYTTNSITQRFNLRDFVTDNTGFRLIPDEDDVKYPGFAVRCIDDAPLIKQEGAKVPSQASEWILYMKNRPLIEQAVPGLVQTIQICKNGIPD